MADISFPAHITVVRQADVDGLPILTAEAQVVPEVAALPLPAGPAGPRGRRGRPRTTFYKMGAIANAAARPTGLGAEDRGKWWHRLDTDGMDLWTGSAWSHSPGAVGPQGPAAFANTLEVIGTEHNENLTEPAIEFTGADGNQQVKVTVPAGLRGPKGPAGASGQITASPDFDTATTPNAGDVFAWDPALRKFRSSPAPLGAGPWSWYQEDFPTAETVTAVSRIEGGVFTIPAQPFTWRPVVYGHLYAYSANNGAQSVEPTVRLGHSQGALVAAGVASAGGWIYGPVFPTYRDGTTTQVLSPSSTFATVPAGQPATLVVASERVGTGTGNIGFSPARASLVVFAEPIE